MPRRLIIVVLAIIAGGVAAYLIGVYLNQQRQAIQLQEREELARRQEMQAQVVVAATDIPKATTIEPQMLQTKTVPKEYVQPQAVSHPDRVLGMVTAVPLSKGEQIAISKLVSSKQATITSLAMATPVGKRAISVAVDNIASLMGMIKPGDYVDVICFVPVPTQTPEGKQVNQVAVMPLFQNILVLAMGRDLGGRTQEAGRYTKEESTAPPLITLALTPQEANMIAFVTEQGKIRLVLRSPADSRIEPIQPASWETVFQYLMPQLPQEAKAQAEKETQLASQEKLKTREIEIYRGLKRETIQVSKGE